MKRTLWSLLVVGIVLCAGTCWASEEPPEQRTDAKAVSNAPSGSSVARGVDGGAAFTPFSLSFAKDFWSDQKAIWTAPLRLRLRDGEWLLPIGLATGGLIAGDRELSRQMPQSPRFVSRSSRFGDYGLGAMVGTAGGLYFWGRLTNDDQKRAAGLLSGEAVLDGTVAVEALKLFTQRPRPKAGDGRGGFGAGGDSFASEHSMAAWAIASVVTNEYPGPLTKLLGYGGASAISLSRLLANKHFASDVAVGSALGWAVGRYVYRVHREAASDGEDFGTFVRASEPHERDPGMIASTYVPLDSWVYGAFDRLVALGRVQSGFIGLRPWTRAECGRLLQESESMEDGDSSAPAEVRELNRELRTEFREELAEAYEKRPVSGAIDSVYFRMLGISGGPLTDGMHFAQSIINDSGRTSREGANMVSGVTTRAMVGPIALYVNGEYQYSPSAPALSAEAWKGIASQFGVPQPPTLSPYARVNRLRLLDAYLSVNLKNWQLSFGQQSLWWGPGYGSAMLLSDNAAPVKMLRLDRVTPFSLPSIGQWLGKFRVQAFFGQMAGDRFVAGGLGYGQMIGDYQRVLDPQPYIYGGKISTRLTPNLEMGWSMTTQFSGPGQPLTFGNLLHTFSFRGSGQARDPGDRRTGFDFSYRIPGLRNWLTLYNDSVAEDEPNPIGYPRRSAMNPGIYLSHVPGVSKLDLRVEGVYTDVPNLRTSATYYTNRRVRDGYVNDGYIMGSWIGSQGRGGQAWSTYRFSPRSNVQFGYRTETVNREVLEGGSLRDFFVRGSVPLYRDLQFDGMFQYERWAFPILSTVPQRNIAISIQLTYRLSH